MSVRECTTASPVRRIWSLGAPRIHGELLKRGITISERTVSRYLRGRPTTRSQTWRTFLASHFAGQISPLIFAKADNDDIVVDASVSRYRAPSIDASCAFLNAPPVVSGRSQQPSSLAVSVGQQHLRDRSETRNSAAVLRPSTYAATSLAAATHVRVPRRVPLPWMAVWNQFPACSTMGSSEYRRQEQSDGQRRRRAGISFRPGPVVSKFERIENWRTTRIENC
jgi:hypothetical protein